MRIIAGKFRSRVLAAPKGMATRPTSDRLRETLFNVLGARVEGAAFLDLYAGSGAVGLEALSRGARSVVFVERAPAALKVLRANLAALKVEGAAFRVFGGSVAGFLGSGDAASPGTEKYGVIYLDPPYDAEKEYEQTVGQLGGEVRFPRSPNARDPSTGSGQARGHPLELLGRERGSPRSENRDRGHPILDANAVVVAEHRRKCGLEGHYGALRRTRLLEQGDAALSFYGVG
jgi:16S rRNA (guanine966-N2)-methyltransferase